MQEIELKQDCDPELLLFNGYFRITESNDVKSRVGIYMKNGIDYVRRADLELRNNVSHGESVTHVCDGTNL